MRRRAAGAVLAAVALSVGCRFVLGIEERPLGSPFEAGAGSDDGGPSAQSLDPPGCGVSPSTDAAVIEERCGVFVSQQGDDAAAGSRAAPLRTLAAGVRAAQARRVYRVYLCGTRFEENVAFGETGVSLFGGFACDGSWRVTGEKPIVAPPTGPALALNGTNNAVVVEALRFEAAAATRPSGSSIAVVAASVQQATFTRVEIASGAGANGADGEAGAVGAGGGTAGALALGGGGGTPGRATTCDCILGDASVGTTTGGAGGKYPSLDATAGLPALDGGAPGSNAQNVGACTPGGAGAAGAPGITPAAPATYGAIATLEFLPTSGESGSTGTVGQGGGGGGGWTLRPGGGGGCGGCPSTGGGGGGGGGASVGVLAIEARLFINASTLSTGPAGSGGAGGVAPPGQLGGAGGGNLQGGSSTCRGGDGGAGGRGGDGAPGVGGLSVGVLHRGPAPSIDAASIVVLGTAGVAGDGGAGGRPGVSQAVLAL